MTYKVPPKTLGLKTQERSRLENRTWALATCCVALPTETQGAEPPSGRAAGKQPAVPALERWKQRIRSSRPGLVKPYHRKSKLHQPNNQKHPHPLDLTSFMEPIRSWNSGGRKGHTLGTEIQSGSSGSEERGPRELPLISFSGPPH